MNDEIIRTMFEQKYIYILIGIIIVFVFVIVLFLLPHTRKTFQQLISRIKRISVNTEETAVEFSEKNIEENPLKENYFDEKQAKDKHKKQPSIELKLSKLKKVKIKNFFGKLKTKGVIMDDVEINGGSSNNVKNRK